ncbi:hypothetical protein CANCADRAFT_2657 [Tortispora caseinolytica NRRL Y-17796]|uniref:Uncharacterized protein n=1 Tax=Tortispora caseinolytica NRRL Y-17796 TaxID=767744 RepID=A0A1E4TGT5_9ASCO|nr:hypothetical protein CANCADRAFT_2657 [Tortispora caseinolytica NRRL Y-17796]
MLSRSITRNITLFASNSHRIGSVRAVGSYAHYIKPPRKRVWPKYALTITAFTGLAVYVFWPRHPFSREVAQTLRKGLRAEYDADKLLYPENLSAKPLSDQIRDRAKAAKLLKDALHFILAAQEQSMKEYLSPISDEFTGILLKAAKVAEKVGEIDLASAIYSDIMQIYYTILTYSPTKASDVLHMKPDESIFLTLRSMNMYRHEDAAVDLTPYVDLPYSQNERCEFITRALLAALRAALIESERPPSIVDSQVLSIIRIAMGESALMLGMSQEKFQQDLKLPRQIFDKPQETITSTTIKNAISSLGMTPSGQESASLAINEGPADAPKKTIRKISIKGTEPPNWLPYRDHLISVLDAYSKLCMAHGDAEGAIGARVTCNVTMMGSGSPLIEVLLGKNNFASLLYMVAENLRRKAELYEEAGNSRAAEIVRLRAERTRNNCENTYKEVLSLCDKLGTTDLRTQKISGLGLALGIYESTGDAQEIGIDAMKAMAVYGLAEIAIYDGDLDKAVESLKESRLRAKGCGFKALLPIVTEELSKIQKSITEQSKAMH